MQSTLHFHDSTEGDRTGSEFYSGQEPLLCLIFSYKKLQIGTEFKSISIRGRWMEKSIRERLGCEEGKGREPEEVVPTRVLSQRNHEVFSLWVSQKKPHQESRDLGPLTLSRSWIRLYLHSCSWWAQKRKACPGWGSNKQKGNRPKSMPKEVVSHKTTTETRTQLI